MTRETKVGLLVGMGVILLIGIIISDHLSVVQHQDPAALTDFAGRAQDSINPLVKPEADMAQAQLDHEQPTVRESVLQRLPQATNTVPTPNELQTPPWKPVPQGESAPALPELPRAYGVAGAATGGSPANPALENLAGQPLAAQPAAQQPTAPTEGVPSLTLSHVPSADPFPTRAEEPTSVGQMAAATTSRATSLFDQTTDTVQVLGAPAPSSALQTTEDAGAASTSSSEIIHYVGPGETLYEIAKKYYGNGDYWRIIAEHNKGKVRDNGQVNESVRLVVPNRAGLAQLGPDFIPVAREGARPVSAQTARPATASKGYTVQAGDTLTKIASKTLGDGARWKEIFDANKKTLKTPEALSVGMELVIPGQQGSASGTVQPLMGGRTQPMPAAQLRLTQQQPQPTPAAPANGRSSKEYTVEAGDNLAYIAEVTLGSRDRWREVFEANRDRLATPDALKVGMKLRVPQ